jgi:hypothetical protein
MQVLVLVWSLWFCANYQLIVVYSVLCKTPWEKVLAWLSWRVLEGHGMGSFLPLHHPGSWACSMAYTHVKLRNGKQCHSAAFCMCGVLCSISAAQPDVFCHSVLLSVIFYDHDQQHCYHQASTVKTEAATAVVVAPDVGHEDARNMLTCI